MAEPQIKDQRGWAPVDTGYLDNPKMLDVLDASGTATLMHLASILYCAQHFTDGHISPGVARRKVGAPKDDDRLLIDAGLWHETGHDCPDCPDPDPGKVYVHNFLEHNRTAAQAKRVSERRSEAAKARWAKAKAPDAPSMQSAVQDAVQPAMQNGDVCNAEREKERKRDSSAPKRAESPPEGFDAWWAQWPKKVAKAAALKAYKTALKKTDALTLGQSAAAFITAEQRKGTAIEYIPNASTWLNQERWEDDTSTPPAMAPKPEWMKYV